MQREWAEARSNILCSGKEKGRPEEAAFISLEGYVRFGGIRNPYFFQAAIRRRGS